MERAQKDAAARRQGAAGNARKAWACRRPGSALLEVREQREQVENLLAEWQMEEKMLWQGVCVPVRALCGGWERRAQSNGL